METNLMARDTLISTMLEIDNKKQNLRIEGIQ